MTTNPSPHFDTPPNPEIEAIRARLGRLLGTTRLVHWSLPDGDFLLVRDVAAMMLRPGLDDHGVPVVLLRGIVLIDIPFTVELVEWLADETQSITSFDVMVETSDDGHDTLMFEHIVDTDDTTDAELLGVALAILDDVERHASRLEDRFGGQQFWPSMIARASEGIDIGVSLHPEWN
jgi:hypothetical protein